MSWRKLLASSLAGLMLLGTVSFPALGAERRRIVVLPFRNLSQQPADHWLSESFSESLIMGLGQSRALRLIERSEIQAVLKEQALMQSVLADPAQAPQLGQLMGAEYMVVGHFQRVADQLQAQVRLVNVATGEIESASLTQVQGRFDNLFDLQAELAQQLLRQLDQAHADGSEATSLQTLQQAMTTTPSTQAHEAYIRGLALLAPMNTDSELQQSLDFFQQAIAQDPAYAQAHAGLAEVYARRAMNPVLYPSHRPDDAQKAMQAAQRALNLQPHSASAYLALSQVHRAQEAPAEALSAAEQAVRYSRESRYLRQYLELKYLSRLTSESEMATNPDLFYEVIADLERLGADLDDPLLLELLSFSYMALVVKHPERDHSVFMQRLERALAAQPRQVGVGVMLAIMQRILGQRAAFHEIMNRLEAANQDNPLGLFLQALTLSSMGSESEQALRLINQSLKLQPDLVPAYQLRANLYTRQFQNLPLARADFARSLELAPEQPEVLKAAALFHLKLKEPGEAERLLLRAQALNQAGRRQAVLAADLDFHLGQAYQQQGKRAQALQQYKLALDNPAIQGSQRFIAFLRARAELLAEQGDFAAALQDMTRVLELNPDWSAVQQEYKAYYLQQQLQAAPQDSRLHNDLGQIYLQMGAAEQALKHLLTAHQIDPGHAVITYNLGLAYQHLGQHAEARQAFENVLRQDPGYAKAHLSLAQMELAAGQHAQAEARLKSLLQLDPEYVKALEVLAGLYQSQGQRAQAQTLWQRLLDLDPQHFKAREQLEQLK